jgi:hypothetical protein
MTFRSKFIEPTKINFNLKMAGCTPNQELAVNNKKTAMIF